MRVKRILSYGFVGLASILLVGCSNAPSTQTNTRKTKRPKTTKVAKIQEIDKKYQTKVSPQTIHILNQDVNSIKKQDQKTKKATHKQAPTAKFNAKQNTFNITASNDIESALAGGKNDDSNDQNLVSHLFALVNVNSRQLPRQSKDNKLAMQISNSKHQVIYSVHNGHIDYSKCYVNPKDFQKAYKFNKQHHIPLTRIGIFA